MRQFKLKSFSFAPQIIILMGVRAQIQRLVPERHRCHGNYMKTYQGINCVTIVDPVDVYSRLNN